MGASSLLVSRSAAWVSRGVARTTLRRTLRTRMTEDCRRGWGEGQMKGLVGRQACVNRAGCPAQRNLRKCSGRIAMDRRGGHWMRIMGAVLASFVLASAASGGTIVYSNSMEKEV